jgi:sialate O-acetylesterase
MSILKRFALFVCAALCLPAAVRLPTLVSDHMVLQQDLPVRIWGHADPGEAVSVQFHGQTVAAKAGADGRWAVYLNPLNAGGPFEMTVAGQNVITIHDVLVGEVWVGSGQSNMEFRVAGAKNAEQEIAEANYPNIRLFEVKKAVAEQPAEDVEGQWVLCSPETVGKTSAVGYFFSREIHKTRDLPVGFIHSSWGGTPAQSWTTRATLESDLALKTYLDQWQKTLENYPAAKERFDKQLEVWKQKAAEAKKHGQQPPQAPRPPAGPGHQNTPGGLYNGMIAPLVPYAIRGAIWYQGESNASPGNATLYRRLFEAMIEDWRHMWGEGCFPFLFVQLANYAPGHATAWPELQESQLKTLELRNTGMAVIIDIGDSKNIHPTNKQEVGRRLALAARATVYGENIEYSGPIFRQLTADGSQLRAWFDHAGGLAARNGDKLTGFTIAASDRNFVPAEARIEGDTVVISSPDVKEPVAVRYAWASDPAANLINKENLPASPFRTDDWSNAKMPK